MESIDFSKFKEFKFIRNKMNIQGKDFVDFNMGKVFSQPDWQDPPLREGITISADDNSVEYKADGIFYAGKRVLLYIPFATNRRVDTPIRCKWGLRIGFNSQSSIPIFNLY